MSDTAQSAVPSGPVNIHVRPPLVSFDFATFFGLIFALGLIAAAIYIGQSNANFLNGPSFMIVILGTMASTSISYTGDELRKSGGIIGRTFFRSSRDASAMARTLLDMSALARSKGVLALSQAENELRKDPFLHKAAQYVTDGYQANDIDRLLGQEIDTLSERHRNAAGMLKRAAEIAPAMGLIGTLVGLVQMLAELDNPSNIGPAMAVALLTTFYGAILGTVIIAPMAAKLERNSMDEIMIKTLILIAMTSITKQENPRRLEMLLNAKLPPEKRIRYFD